MIGAHFMIKIHQTDYNVQFLLTSEFTCSSANFFCCLTLEFNAFNFLGSFTRQQFLLFEMKRRKKKPKIPK